jgi:hypothetical protein
MKRRSARRPGLSPRSSAAGAALALMPSEASG